MQLDEAREGVFITRLSCHNQFMLLIRIDHCHS